MMSHALLSMHQSGGGDVAAAKRAKVSSSVTGARGEDRLSALPDDVLVLILLHLTTDAAARTSVLSRRWRHVWTLLPELRFGLHNNSHCLSSVLSASELPLRCLAVQDPDASPQSVAAWLPAAARRVSGHLFLHNSVPEKRFGEDEVDASERCVIELPCFEKATSIYLKLGFIGLTVPPAGVFAQLTDLDLSHVWLHGPGELGDAISSPRCPCLHKLTICDVRGLDSITIDSESLRLLELSKLCDLRRITVVAPALADLVVFYCFFTHGNQPVVRISAPQLKVLRWVDAYDAGSVHLGSMEQLQMLGTFFIVSGQHGFTYNDACLMLLRRFKVVEHLYLLLCYLPEIGDLQYLMEDMTVLPSVTSLHLMVMARGHAFGASLFHVLRVCSCIKRLMLTLFSQFNFEEPSECSSGCICDQLTNWKTEELSLNCLEELEIEWFRASEHEVAFVKQLLNCRMSVLKMITMAFGHSVQSLKARPRSCARCSIVL